LPKKKGVDVISDQDEYLKRPTKYILLKKNFEKNSKKNNVF